MSALDMSEQERKIVARHAEHWRAWVESGQMVISGPALDAAGHLPPCDVNDLRRWDRPVNRG
jgi:hypothetical protein